jgi:hypothetical protein
MITRRWESAFIECGRHRTYFGTWMDKSSGRGQSVGELAAAGGFAAGPPVSRASRDIAV